MITAARNYCAVAMLPKDFAALREETYPAGVHADEIDEALEMEINLRAINETLHNHSLDIYEELAGKIDSTNATKAVAESYEEIKRPMRGNAAR